MLVRRVLKICEVGSNVGSVLFLHLYCWHPPVTGGCWQSRQSELIIIDPTELPQTSLWNGWERFFMTRREILLINNELFKKFY